MEGGAENHFTLTGIDSAFVKTLSSGHHRKGLVYKLVLNREEYEPVVEVKT